MLGETYELVTEDYRYIAEQVSHHPPITAFAQEGKGYIILGFLDTKSKFGFGGGKGQMVIEAFGYVDYVFDQYENEMISFGRPKIYANNIVLGTLTIEYEGELKAINNRTG